MNDWITVTGLTLVAGAAMPIGGMLARAERIRPRWLETEFRHAVIAFGGGALLAAIALVLVPEGSRRLAPWQVALWFPAGALAFMGIDILLSKVAGRVSQLVAMLTDFVPEALALGAALALDSPSCWLLAGLIALQNLPEGFNSYREVIAAGVSDGWRVIGCFALLALLGPIAGLTGYFWLSAHPALVSGIMVFAAGGILYLIFQDIAPQARLARHWAPPLGAVAGFLLGILGHMLISGQGTP